MDRGQIFQIISANVNRNRHLAKHPVEVLQLDFTADGLPEKILSALPQVNTVIAADGKCPFLFIATSNTLFETIVYSRKCFF